MREAQFEKMFPRLIITNAADTDDKMGHPSLFYFGNQIVSPFNGNTQTFLSPQRAIVIQDCMGNNAAQLQRFNHNLGMASASQNQTIDFFIGSHVDPQIF